MKKYKKELILILLILIDTIIIIDVFKEKNIKVNYKEISIIEKTLNKIDLYDINKIMIVAHPDDESIWGGSHLLNDSYLVVCITCGIDENRNKEFNNAMNKTNDPYITLGYPDKTDGKRDDWKSSYDNIEKDIKEIIDYKNWNGIVTHNPDGEYGHEHHKMTSEIVTNVSNTKKIYYFSKYYSKEDTKDDKKLTDKELLEKEQLLKIYSSQAAIINNHYHVVPYENFITYEEWNIN